MKKYLFIPIMVSLILVGGITILLFGKNITNKNNDFDYQRLIASFNDNSQNTEEIKQTKIIIGGDVMLGRSVEIASRQSNDYNYPFLNVADYLNTADIVLVNLENPVVENCPTRDSGLIFCANPEMLSGLKYAGINVVNLANNHTSNYGESGIADTRKYLATNNIGYTGLGELYVLLTNGTKFGFLGFNRAESSVPLSNSEIDLVRDSASAVDVLIVAMHWGNEYRDKANAYQRETAKILVENGADVVVGHHPHWVQPFGYAQGKDGEEKPVYYSLGNFVFDQMWSEKTKEGMLVELVFEDTEIVEEKFLDIYIDKLGQPVIRE